MVHASPKDLKKAMHAKIISKLEACINHRMVISRYLVLYSGHATLWIDLPGAPHLTKKDKLQRQVHCRSAVVPEWNGPLLYALIRKSIATLRAAVSLDCLTFACPMATDEVARLMIMAADT